MDLINYLNYHYVDENPEWMKKAMHVNPKSFTDICFDLIIKVTLVMFVFLIFFGGIRLLLFIWKLHNEKMNELEELNRNYLEQLLRQRNNLAGGDNANNRPPQRETRPHPY